MSGVQDAWLALTAAETAKGKEKTQILLKAKEDLRTAAVLQEYFRFCFDPFITFGVTLDPKDIAIPPRLHSDEVQEHWWVKLTHLLDALNNREFTGNDARFQIVSMIKEGGEFLAKWALPLINRELKIGVSIKTVEKVFPGLLRNFECQLATEWDAETLPPRAVVEPKYDGVRGLLFISPGDRSFALSRNGKPLNNVSHIIDELLLVVEGQFVFDGEFFTEDWSKSISAVRSAEKGDTSIRFRAFDILPLKEFQDKTCCANLEIRQAALGIICGQCKRVSFVPGIPVSTIYEAQAAADKWVKEGYEGGVMKSLDGGYEYSRTQLWLKIKPFISLDLPIVGFEEGKNRNAGRLGAFIVEHEGVQSRVGSMPDAVREDVWANQDKYLGKTIEVKCQEVVKSSGALRFPTFLRFRPDKDE